MKAQTALPIGYGLFFVVYVLITYLAVAQF